MHWKVPKLLPVVPTKLARLTMMILVSNCLTRVRRMLSILKPAWRSETTSIWLDEWGMEKHKIGVFSAHQMSTCRLSSSRENSVVEREWRIMGMRWFANSIFPATSGANLMLTILTLPCHTCWARDLCNDWNFKWWNKNGWKNESKSGQGSPVMAFIPCPCCHGWRWG